MALVAWKRAMGKKKEDEDVDRDEDGDEEK